MKDKYSIKHIFVIHGPNMNLISLRPLAKKNRLTLDKINKFLRTEAKTIGHTIKTIQTNDESRAVTSIQRIRNNISGIIIFPGSWQKSAHAIKDTLEILQIPFVTVSTGEEVNLLNGIDNIEETDLLKGCRLAVKRLTKLV